MCLPAGPAARNRATADPFDDAADTNPSRALSQFTTHVLSIVRQPRPFTLSSIGVPMGPDAGTISKLWVTSMPF